MYEARIETVMQNLARRDLSQMLVCDPRSIQYLTGAYLEPGERFLGLVLAESGTPTLVYNEMFAVPSDLSCATLTFNDTEDPLALAAGLLDPSRPLGCDKNLAARFLLPLMERGAASAFVLASDVVDDARAHKSAEERDLMRTASHTNDAAMARFKGLVREGATEAEVAGHLADMGLDTPRATAQVRYQDGTEMTLELGGDVPTTSYSYFRWSGDDGVYMCDSGLTDALLTTATRLLPVEQPALSKDLIDQVTLSRADGETAVLLSNDGDGHYSGLLVEPYQYPVDPEQAEALLTALSSFRLGPREAEANAETRAQYGLDDPELTLWLHQAAGTVGQVDENGQLAAVEVREQALRFVIGRAEGEFFYTCEYAGSCYLVSSFLLETLLAATPDTLVARQPADLGGAALSDILIESPLGDVHVTAQYTERVLPNNDIETDAEGNTVYDTAVTLNGEEADAELLTTLTTRLNALTASGDLPDGWTVPEDETPRWRIVLTTVGGATREIAAYRLDAFSDALAVDGVAIHYVHEEAIDLILADLLD